MGYDVDLITFEDANCLENACIEQNMRELRVPLSVEDFGLHLISDDSESFNDPDIIYDVFLAMGIKKLPQIPMLVPPGRYLNIYFCQFPYDWARGGKDFDKKLDLWATYDYIVLNSKYSHDWYAKATIPWIHRGLKRNIYVPTTVLLYQPVLPFKSAGKYDPGSGGPGSEVIQKFDAESQLSKLQEDGVNIAIIGPFLAGDFTPAHTAIRLFGRLTRDPKVAKSNVHLFIIGKVSPSSQVEQFMSNLRGNMTDRLTSKVSFMFDASSDEISNTLSSCLIVWDLAFLNYVTPRFPEPLGEPFPFNLLSSMFSGVIPVAVNLAGHPEVITPSFNGYLGRTDDDILDRTMHIIEMTDTERSRLRLNSLKTAYSYGLESFQKSFSSFVHDGIKHKDLTVLTRTRLKDTWNMPLRTEPLSIGFVAVLLAPSMHATLELQVRNILAYLGQGWAFQIHHTKDNVALCKQVLAGVPNLQYVELKIPLHTDDDYSRLMKMESFWKQFKENEKVLILTLDSYMLRYGIRDYMNYDYVAPPLPINILEKYNLNPDGTYNSKINTDSGAGAGTVAGEGRKRKKHLRAEQANTISNSKSSNSNSNSNSNSSSHELDLWSDDQSGHSGHSSSIPIVIQSRDMLRSFERLRPSLSSDDLQFYDSVYSRFTHQSSGKGSDYSIADNSNDVAKQSSGKGSDYSIADNSNDVTKQRVALK